ncbi:hypothetical protein D8I24_4475 [Cupriavidus necator H850]|nr:hypothetical protein D8I24_4475 [Cupriavidus necator H850]
MDHLLPFIGFRDVLAHARAGAPVARPVRYLLAWRAGAAKRLP